MKQKEKQNGVQILASGNQNLMKRSAFTLAEVLITLGIIGVVAAMTLPTVLQKAETQKLELYKLKIKI